MKPPRGLVVRAGTLRVPASAEGPSERYIPVKVHVDVASLFRAIALADSVTATTPRRRRLSARLARRTVFERRAASRMHAAYRAKTRRRNRRRAS